MLQSQKSLFAAYANLDQSESTYDLTNPPLYERRRPGMPDKLELRSNISIDPGLFRELEAAREEQQKKEGNRPFLKMQETLTPHRIPALLIKLQKNDNVRENWLNWKPEMKLHASHRAISWNASAVIRIHLSTVWYLA